MPDLPKVATLDEKNNGVAGMCECGYHTRGWPNAKIAKDRILQHLNEHATRELMEPIQDFRGRHGLVQDTVNPIRAVFPDGAKVVKVEE